MTRINCVDPSSLTDKHLIAEYRELPRIFQLVRSAQSKGKTPEDFIISHNYHLGKGHVTFFYNKLLWLVNRQSQLIREMQSRGFKPTFLNVDNLLEGINSEWINDWIPDESAKAINMARIEERLKK